MFYTKSSSLSDNPDDLTPVITSWKKAILPSVDILNLLAGTTEDEFLQIGSQLQQFHARSNEISKMANELVETVSGELAQTVIRRLRQIISEMEEYLAGVREQSNESCTTLEQILALLDRVSEPLEGFNKMYKTLRMLSISTKIESARIGEKGIDFLTLAMDVEKLSHQVNNKSGNIMLHRQTLSQVITENLQIVRASESAQDSEVCGILKSTSASLESLVLVNERCNNFGELVSSISCEVSGNIGEVVSSMQAHDITRQQIEHIVEALERLVSSLEPDERQQFDLQQQKRLITEAGDVCELQAAQLRHAAAELHVAVVSIVENLRDVARKQSQMAEQTSNLTGVDGSSGNSFVEGISCGLATVTGVLAKCSQTDRELSGIMQKVAQTIGEISGFVTDIEEIGSEIDLIALNSQIKAAHTGVEGAALGVLAEAIKRLSLDAVVQTEAVSQTLLEVNDVTGHLLQDAVKDVGETSGLISVMEADIEDILGTLGRMNSSLFGLLSDLSAKVRSLTDDIEQITSGINVHEQMAAMAENVFSSLEKIVVEAREIEPASTEFKENLRHMEECYTMASERHIHEAIARKRSGGKPESMVFEKETAASGSDDSEFGDNIDLF